MKIIKTKGIVIKEVNFKENDKIITILTEDLGKISCFARGARKTSSPLLSCSQFLVYSEFVLFKGTTFYNINSGDIINTFYDLRIDYDKLECAFLLSKILNNLIDEDIECKNILQLFLNILYIIKEEKYEKELTTSIFKLKLMAHLGYAPNVSKCNECNLQVNENTSKELYFSYITGSMICKNCIDKLDSTGKEQIIKSGILLKESTIYALQYVIYSENKKIFSFKLADNSKLEFINYISAIFNMNFKI